LLFRRHRSVECKPCNAADALEPLANYKSYKHTGGITLEEN
jgi:hypothetical protein